MGHHVQQQLGTSDQVARLQRDDPGPAQRALRPPGAPGRLLRGRLGAHGAYRRGELEAGDLEEALGAAQAVGDDRLQRRAGGTVDADTFTHGTSAQREHWFQAGFAGGDAGACDTFAADQV